MAIPVYLWLYDDAGRLIKGGVDVHERENSIEIIFLSHCIELKYEKIKWHYLKGNIIQSDSWNERNVVAI